MTNRKCYRLAKMAAFILVLAAPISSSAFAVQIKVACAQMCSHSSLQTNVNNMISRIQSEAALGTEVIVFHECALTDYDCNVWAGLGQAAISNAISQVAAACLANKVYAIFGTPYYENGICYNAAMVIGPDGQIIHQYNKAHVVETCTTNGSELAIFRIKGEPATIFICHDERYPELMRIPVYAGAKIGFYISYESYDLSKEFNYRCQIVGRAVENQSWVVACNAPMGNDSGDSHGQSRIIGPDGTVYAEAGRTETIIRYTIDTAQSSNAWAQAGATTPLLSEFWKEGLRVVQSQNLDYFGSVTANPSLLSNTGVLGSSSTVNLKIACSQIRMSSNINTNVASAVAAIASEAAQGTRVVVLPECAVTDRNPAVLANVTQAQIDSAISQIASACHTYNVYAIVGSPFRGNSGQLYNGAYVIDPNGNTIKRYAQLHTDLPGTFVDGTNMSLFKIDGMYATVLVGHDIHYPELSRIAVLADAKVIFCIAYEASNASVSAAESMTVARAVENQCFSVFCNAGTGNDARDSTGHSRIVSPGGTVYVEAGSGNNTAVRYTISGSQALHDWARNGYYTSSLTTYWQEGLDIIRRNNPEFYGDPVDTTPPGNVSGLTATPGSGQNTLSWTNPTDSDFRGTKIMFKTTGYPADPSDGTQCFTGSGTSVIHSGLVGGITYYYKAFAYDAVPNYASGAQANAVPAVGNPGNVTGLSAFPANGLITLSWTNVGRSVTGTKIVFKTTGYPSSTTDGTSIYDGNATSFAHSGLTNGVTYYYTAFAHDAAPYYASGTQVSGIPAARITPDWINETFDSYSDGNLIDPKWAITGSASAQVESTLAKGGTGKATLMDTVASGQSTVNEISTTDKTSGYCYLSFDVCEDAAGATGQTIANVTLYGSNSTTELTQIQIQKGRIMVEDYSGGLLILTTSVANLTWYNVKLGLNIDTKSLDLWLDGSSKGTGYAWNGLATRISRIVISSDRNANLTTQKAYIDNLRLEPKPGQVAAVSTDGGWTPGLSKLHFTFGAVSGTDSYQYAIGATSGGTQTRSWTNCGTSNDVTATGLPLAENTNYYISVQCLNLYGTAGANRTSAPIKVAPGLARISDAKALADGTSTTVKALRAKLVSATFPGCFYIQEPDAPFGMKVISPASVNPGDQIDVCGIMKGTGGERYMDITGNGMFKTAGPAGPYSPVLDTASLGGVGLNTNTPGVVGGIGPNNIGSYVTIFGKVTQSQTANPKYFYLDDGKGLLDGTSTGGAPNVGVRVVADPAAYPQGSFVAVNGIVSCFSSAGLRPEMLSTSVTMIKPAP